MAIRVANESEHRSCPRQVVVRAHRPTHESEPGKGFARLGHALALVEAAFLLGPAVRPLVVAGGVDEGVLERLEVAEAGLEVRRPGNAT